MVFYDLFHYFFYLYFDVVLLLLLLLPSLPLLVLDHRRCWLLLQLVCHVLLNILHSTLVTFILHMIVQMYVLVCMYGSMHKNQMLLLLLIFLFLVHYIRFIRQHLLLNYSCLW